MALPFWSLSAGGSPSRLGVVVQEAPRQPSIYPPSGPPQLLPTAAPERRGADGRSIGQPWSTSVLGPLGGPPTLVPTHYGNIAFGVSNEALEVSFGGRRLNNGQTISRELAQQTLGISWRAFSESLYSVALFGHDGPVGAIGTAVGFLMVDANPPNAGALLVSYSGLGVRYANYTVIVVKQNRRLRDAMAGKSFSGQELYQILLGVIDATASPNDRGAMLTFHVQAGSEYQTLQAMSDDELMDVARNRNVRLRGPINRESFIAQIMAILI